MSILDKRIIYPNEDGGINILIPAPSWIGTLEQLAQKDVPNGIAYLIIDAEDVPEDRTYREAWEADFSNPDGYGG